MDLTRCTALITGGASGLGAATATRLAGAGAHVVALDLPQALEGKNAPQGVRYLAGDVTSADDIRNAFESVRSGPPLRVVVNCAGIAPARKTLSSRGAHELDLFRRTIEINLIGTFNVLSVGASVIAEQDPDENGQRGVIVNTASVAAFEGQIGQVAYAASKGGIVALCLPAARDLAAYGIRVNTIAPGIVDTPLLAALGESVNESLAGSVPFPRRLARPDEFAQLAQMIIEHDYLNGETIRMDGAIRMPPS
ncbi:SDR family NAD(P)-dependent oxidoreductase [Microbacterium lacus]|uniref:SDR family NAD(P)-dependent oxidoreductase n=1 Tax=Microbacterium lacus TaxID=415217 RepID=UPI00384EB472